MKLSNYKLDDTLQAVFGDGKIGCTTTFSLIQRTAPVKGKFAIQEGNLQLYFGLKGLKGNLTVLY